jgi:hypothetical protein
MDLDALKEKWAEQDRKLDTAISLNRQLLLAANLQRVQSPLRRFALFTGAGVFQGAICLVILGGFIYTHWTEPRFAVPALLLHVWIIAYTAASIRLIAMALHVEYAKPIALIQKEIGALRMLRLQMIRWALLTGQVVWWIPALIVALKGLWDVDAYQVFSPAFLLTNVAIGLALIPVAIWVSRKYGHRTDRFPAVAWLTRELAGHYINATSDFLATLSEFEREPGD